MNIKDAYIHNGEAILKDIQISGSKLQKLKAGKNADDTYLTWVDVLDLSPFGASGHNHDDRYVKKSGDTMTGLLTTTSGGNHKGIKVGDTYINAIGSDLIFQNNGTIRFGGDSWDYNVWAGLKYVHSSKTIYLGLADGSAFTANSAQSGGKLYTPGISDIYIGNGTYTVYHTNNLSIKTLMGTTAIGDADEPVYWNGSSFVKAGAYPTKASWNYDDIYLKLSGGTITGVLEVPDINSVRYNMSHNVTYSAGYSNAVSYSPLAKYIWHDILCFGANGWPTYYTSADGSTWSATELNKSLFIQKDSNSVTVLNSSIKGCRWVWNSGNFHACQMAYLLIGTAYVSSSCTFSLDVEKSVDGSTWTSMHSSTDNRWNAEPFIAYLTNGLSNTPYFRITMIRTSTSGNLALASIKGLSPRLGNQGLGKEVEFPYTWDSDNNINITGSFTASSFKKIGGTASQFLKADGSVDSNTYSKSNHTHTFSEIGPGVATIGDGVNRLMFRTDPNWKSGMYYSTAGNEALVFGTANPMTSWIFATTDPTTQTAWTSLTPSLQIKHGRVVINKLIATSADASYNLDVNGSANATTLYENGVRVSINGHTHDDRYYTESEVNNLLANKSNTSHTHSYIVTQGDTRDAVTKPNDYGNRITFAGLKINSTIGNPSSTTYSYVVGLRGWSDASGGKSHELAFNDNGIFHRIGATDAWETWAMMLTTSNYNSYVPSLTGTGASGTWGISITGNAASATKATKDGNGNIITNTYLPLSGGIMSNTNKVTNLNADLLDGQHASYFHINTARSYNSVDALPTDSDGWYNIFTLSDSVDGAVICTIKAYAHSSLTFIASKGYAATATLQILQYNESGNGEYFYVKGVRIAEGGKIQALFNKTSGTSKNISVSINIFSSHGTLRPNETLTLETGNPTIIAGPLNGTHGKITSDIIGNLTGNASTATSATTSTYASNVGSSGTVGTNYVTASKVIAACNWYDTMIGSDSDTVINRWSEIVAFVAGFKETPDLATFLSNNYLAKAGGTMTGPLKWANAIALPQQTSPQYFLCIDAFDAGGTTKWADKADTLKALTGLTSTAIGDSDEPVYWNGSKFVKAGAYPTKSSWNYDDKYLKLSGGTLTGTLTINTYSDRSLILDEPSGEKYHIISFRANGEEYAWLCSNYLNSENNLLFNGNIIYHSGNLPAYPTVNNGALYLQANGTTKVTFTANQSDNSTFNIATGSANGTISVGGTNVSVKGLGSNAYSSTAYLPLAGGTMDDTAQIKRAGRSSSWIRGRDNAIIAETSSSGYHPLFSLKTKDGSWELGEYKTSGLYNVPIFSYITDADYSNNNNTYTYQIKYPLASGTIALTADLKWSNISSKPETATRWPSWSEVTNKPSTFTPSSHTHPYIPINSSSSPQGGIGWGQYIFRQNISEEKSHASENGTPVDIQHRTQFKVMRASDTWALTFGVKEGLGWIDCVANGIGYGDIYLNPAGQHVIVGNYGGMNAIFSRNNRDEKLLVFGKQYTSSTIESGGGFKKTGSSDSYVLLGGGGHKAVSDFAVVSGVVTALGTNGNYLTWTKNGTTNNITVPYATKADTLDGYHAYASQLYNVVKSLTVTTVNTVWYLKIMLSPYAQPDHMLVTCSYNNEVDQAHIYFSGMSGGYIYRNNNQNKGNIKAIALKSVYDATEHIWIFYLKFDKIYNSSEQHYSPSSSATVSVYTLDNYAFNIAVETTEPNGVTWVTTGNDDDNLIIKNAKLHGSATYADTAGSVDWSNVTEKPTTISGYGITDALKIDGSNGTADGVSALINKLSVGSSDPTDADYYVCQYAGGGATTTTYHRRPMSAMWNWIKAKTDTRYPTKTGSGASGTWGINITGSANYLASNTSKNIRGLSYCYIGGSTFNTTVDGSWSGYSATTNYNSIVRLQSHTEPAKYYIDLIFDVNNSEIYYRRVTNNSLANIRKIDVYEVPESTASYSLSNAAWTNTITLPTTAGSYILNIVSGNSTLTGVFSIGASDNAKDEISLHLHGNGPRLYARTNGTTLQLSSNDASATSRSVTIKYRRMI